ncbi:MAG: non-ribosomal peptide synthetase, partial [Limisphaerales bacterium]
QRAHAPLVRFHTQWLGDNSFQLIISFHHACLDGWSLAAVITEICQDYLALLKGSEPGNTAPRATYRDFVALEQRAITSPETRRFWARKIENAGAPKLPRWPADLRAGGHEQMRGPELDVPAQHLDGLRNLARAAGVPLKTVLLAAHERVLALMHGSNDVTTGLICNGRPEAVDGERIVGLFLNTLPLRQNLAAGTWLELVKQTFDAEQELLPHRRFPLAEIQKLCGGQAPFETAFDFVHFHVYTALEGSGELDLAEGHYFEANNLTTYTTFMLDATSSRLELHIDYDPNALCREQIEQMSDYYLETLEAMAANPQERYETFSPLSESETRRMVTDWNATAQDFPREQCIDELFDEKAREMPDAIALEVNGVRMTYGRLQTRAEQLAQCLASRGLGHQALVGICLERSTEMIVALLGILKAGGAYVPLDPSYPAERMATMIRDSELKLIVTQSSLRESLASSHAQLLCIEEFLDAGPDEGAARSGALETSELRPSEAGHRTRKATDLAYVIYTSGSTGKPKGVQITHRSVVNLLISAAKTAHVSAVDKLLAVTTLSFDIAGLELFMPLISGGRVILANRDTAGDGTRLSALIETSEPTVMQATPATWRLLIEAGWRGRSGLKILCGGEALTRGLADELLNRASGVWNFYGPTETTIWSTAWKVIPKGPILIGRPLANTEAYILDAALRPVPVGTIGELHLGGEGLARGYLGQPELTADRFIPNPFVAGKRIYKTGDLARYLPDGQIECLGRVD